MCKAPSIEFEAKCWTERNCRMSLRNQCPSGSPGDCRAQRACEMSTVNELVRGFKGKWDFLSMHPAFRLAPMQTTLRLASWRTRCLMRMAATVHLRRSGVRMNLPPNWRGVGKLIYAFRDYYEPELLYLERVLSPGKVYVVAGGYFRIYSFLVMMVVVDAGFVIPVEASFRVFPVVR